MVEVDFRRGAPSSTGFDIVEQLDDATLMAAMPHTGRTHQIRVHCAYAQHPVGGDEKYGSREFNQRLRTIGLKRMFLHAFRITFFSPSDGRTLKIEAPLPKELSDAVKALRIKSADDDSQEKKD